MTDGPLVSIGLPTFNRVESLKRAIESVLAQDYSNLELVVSDNASTDATQKLCLAICERDRRLKYVRQSVNLGGVPNFNEVLRHSSGEFFMWLGDDDWIDPTYVSSCLKVMREQPEYALVCGASKYYRDDRLEFEGERATLTDASGEDRMLAFFRLVVHNATFYGLMRREQASIPRLQNVLGGDWLFVGAMAFQGKVATVTETMVGRSLGGASRSMENITETLGISELHARAPILSIFLATMKDVVWKSRAYGSLGFAGRLKLAHKIFIVFSERWFKPHWKDILYPYWTRPVFFAMSVKKKLQKKT